MSNESRDLLKEFRHIRSLPKQKKRRKRRKESDREFIFRMARYRCEYCRRPFQDKELHVVRKHPQKRLSLLYDGVCACAKCTKEKRGLTHDEFLEIRSEKKKEVREEAQENRFQLKNYIFKKYNYTCIYCIYEFKKMPKGLKLTKDHKIPVSRGGTNDLRNLTCSCMYHNSDKHDLTADEYFAFMDKRKVFVQPLLQKKNLTAYDVRSFIYSHRYKPKQPSHPHRCS